MEFYVDKLELKFRIGPAAPVAVGLLPFFYLSHTTCTGFWAT